MASYRCYVSVRRLLNYVPKAHLTVSAVRGKAGFSDERVSVLQEFLKRKKAMGPEKPSHRNSYLEWNYRAELFAFANRIGEKFKEDTLERAFTQRSHVVFEEQRQEELGISDPKGLLADNQDLAEKGRNIMQEVITQYLRKALPLFPEEGIQSVCNHLTSDENLASVVSRIGAEELILCTDFPAEKSTLASTMCSLVGAVDESSGQERSALFVRDFIITTLSGQEINGIWAPEKPFEVLSEILARDGQSQPEPRLIAHSGINTIIAYYKVGIYCDKKFIGAGSGETAEIAKEQASLDALWRLWGTTDGKLQLPFNLDVSNLQKKCAENISVSDWSSEKVRLKS